MKLAKLILAQASVLIAVSQSILSQASRVRWQRHRQVKKLTPREKVENDGLVKAIYRTTTDLWESEGLDALSEAVAIDSLSPNFNPDWSSTGELHQILDYYISFATKKLGSVAEVSHKIYGGKDASPPTPPFLLLKISGSEMKNGGKEESVFLYTHADTMPHRAEDWTTTSDPTKATRITTEDSDRFYGRGTTDDKYGFIASIIAVQALVNLEKTFPTVYIGVETEEESGSPNLDGYLDQILADIGAPKLVFVLDAGGPNNSYMWNTRTLRGLIMATLKVEVTQNAVHSGTAGGIVPSPLRVMNAIISTRLEDLNGTVIAPPLVYHATEEERAGALELAEVMGDSVYTSLGLRSGVSPLPDPSVTPTHEDIADMIVRNHFQSALAIIGWDHKVIPDLNAGGNILQPYIEVMLSIRCSPYTDVKAAFPELKKIIETDPPHGVNVTLTHQDSATGFSADPLPLWYSNIVNDAAVIHYGAKMINTGVGGTIAFLNTIQRKLQDTSVIHNTGLFDPTSNGHAPDESLDISAGKKFTGVLSYTLHKVATTK